MVVVQSSITLRCAADFVLATVLSCVLEPGRARPPLNAMLRRLSLTLKDHQMRHEVLGAAVPYHEPTSSDDDYDADDDASPASLHDVVSSPSTSASPHAELPSWPSTPSTPISPSSTGRALPSQPLLELSAKTLLWSSSMCSPPCSPPPSEVSYPPHGRRASLQLFHVRQQSLVAMAQSGDVDGLKAALKLDAGAHSVNDVDEVGRLHCSVLAFTNVISPIAIRWAAEHANNNEKRARRRRKHCALRVVRRSAADPIPGGAGRPKFNQLEMVTAFTYRPSLVKIDARNFELSW